MARFILFMWAWMGIVTCLITRFSGAPEPFLGWLIATALAGPPLLYLKFTEKPYG